MTLEEWITKAEHEAEKKEEGGNVKTVEEMREEYETMMENYQAAKERGDYEEALQLYEKAQTSWEPEGSGEKRKIHYKPPTMMCEED